MKNPVKSRDYFHVIPRVFLIDPSVTLQPQFNS